MSTFKWTRRQFSQALAASAAATVIARPGSAFASASVDGLAVIGSMDAAGYGGALHMFRVSGSRWQHASTLPAAAPAHLVQHPTLPVLYAVHDVEEWKHLPRGAVSAYRIDANGTLEHLHTQPLSLSATRPRHAVLTADASHVFVTAEGGGIYNLLPVAADGSLHPVCGIRKEFGAGADTEASTASPRQALLHPDGSILTTDGGQQSLSRFHLRSGVLTLGDRVGIGATGALTHLALGNTHAYALDAASGNIAIHSLCAADRLQPVKTHCGVQGARSLAAHGDTLFAAGGDALSIFRMDPQTGALRLQTRTHGVGSHLVVAADGAHLLGLDGASGTVRWAAFDVKTGFVEHPATVAHVEGAVSALFVPGSQLAQQRVTA